MVKLLNGVHMLRFKRNALPPGRMAKRWFIFLSFYHFLPMPWFIGVAGGLAPPVFLLLGGIASLYSTDFDSFAFAAAFLIPSLVAGLVGWLMSMFLAAIIGRILNLTVRTMILLALLGVCVGISMTPVYITGGHSGGDAFNLLEFIVVLESANVPRPAAVGYFTGLAWVLAFLLFLQYRPDVLPALPRGASRWVVTVILACFICSLVWTHRVLLVTTPLAKLGFASQQYRLAMVMKGGASSRINKSAREWLTLAAEQGHLKSAMELANQPTSAEDKLRWLTFAAEGGLAEAEYELYLLHIRGGDRSNPVEAARWLKRAAEGGNPLAQYELGKLYASGSDIFGIDKDPVESRKVWEHASEQGHGQATNELAWRTNMGVAGYKRDPQRAAKLYEKLAEGFMTGALDLPINRGMAEGARKQAEGIAELQRQIEAGDSGALFRLGRELIDISRDNPESVADGLAMLEQVAESGDADVQYFLGALFIFGNYDHPKNYERGRHWWDRAAKQGYPKAMEYMAKAYQNGQYDTPVDLLKSKELTEKLVTTYRDGRYGVKPDPLKAEYWSGELKHFDRLFEIAGGSYQPLDTLKAKADSGEVAARYQLGRQLLVSGAPADRQRGYRLIEESAEAGFAEAQYRLVTYYENHLHIMRDNPERGVAILTAAAEQNHLPAMGELALAYYKGRYGLPRNYRPAKEWYERLLEVYESGQYLGEINERFIPFQKRQLGYTEKALATQIAREERIANATPFEMKIIEIEDRYRSQYEAAVNSLDRSDGSRDGKARFRAEVDRLRKHYQVLREQEVKALQRIEE